MTYYGTTAASSLSNPPVAVWSALGGAGGNSGLGGTHWLYRSSEAVATVATADYFSDAYQLGMKVGDLITVVVGTAASSATVQYHGTIGAVSTSTWSGSIIELTS